MANPTIGGYEMISIQGRPAHLGESVEEITRPGADGHAWKYQGLRSEQRQLTTVSDFASAGAARAEMAGYAALKGQLVTIVDDFGQTYTDVMILDVR